MGTMPSWSFLSNHGAVLLLVATVPQITATQIGVSSVLPRGRCAGSSRCWSRRDTYVEFEKAAEIATRRIRINPFPGQWYGTWL